MDYCLVILVGCLTAFSGMAYRYATARNVLPVQMLVQLSICGMALFFFRGLQEWHSLVWSSVLIGVVGGLTQYLPVWILRKTLTLGPLSPAWCAFSLGGFVPVILFAMVFLGEFPTASQYVSLAATCLAILFASLGQNGSGGKAATFRERMAYLVCLLTLLIFTGILNVGLKYSTRLPGPGGVGTLLETQQCVIMFFCYLTMGACAVVELSLTRAWRFNRYLWICGSILTFDALLGYSIMLALMTLSATLVFALSNTVSILLAALASVTLFREKRTWYWYAMLVFSILAIVLNR